MLNRRRPRLKTYLPPKGARPLKTRSTVLVTTTVPITADKFCRELVISLISVYDNVIVVSSEGPPLKRIGDELGITTQVIEMPRDPSPRRDLRAVKQWWTLLRKVRPTAVVAMTPKASLLALATARLAKVPNRVYLMVGLRLEGERGLRRVALWALERVTSACATRIVANSPSLFRRYQDHKLARPPKLTHTQPGSDHGVDSDRFRPTPPDPRIVASIGLQNERFTIGFLGRLTFDKGIQTLIAALRDPRLVHRAQLLVVGAQDEPDSNHYLAELTSAPFPVAVTGHVDDVRPFASLMDIHVLPSHREGFPNAVLETACMEIPTITTTATGAVDSVIHQVTGLVVPPGHVGLLADALVALVDDSALRAELGHEARRWAATNFQPSAIVSQVIEQACLATVPAVDAAPLLEN